MLKSVVKAAIILHLCHAHLPRLSHPTAIYSKLPAYVQQLARVFWIHLLEVCWTFAGSCKHPINWLLSSTASSGVALSVAPSAHWSYCRPTLVEPAKSSRQSKFTV